MSGYFVVISVFITLGVVSYLGARYTVKLDRPDALIGIYILFISLAQILATRLAAFDFNLPFLPGVDLTFIAPVGVIVFPFTMQLNDMVNEKFGRKEVYRMIQIAFVSQVLLVIFLWIATIPSHIEKFPGEADPLGPFALVPAITVASWISFLISENLDAWLYDKLRAKIAERLWIRNVFSDIISLGLDSLLFVPLAFLILPQIQGIFDESILYLVTPIPVLIDIIIGQLATKWILGVIDTPFMYLTRWVYENYEH